MALIPCRECGKELSNSAKTCPHCGAKLIASKWLRYLVIAIGGTICTAVVVFVGAGLYVGGKSRKEAAAEIVHLMESRGYKNVSLSYSKYVTRGHDYYTCGMAFAKDAAGAEANRLFYVIQTGATRDLLGAGIADEASFNGVYVQLCAD